jgi:DNA-binding LacI/PurR family transcriptional regulator
VTTSHARTRPATIGDVARLAGVSRQTVSRVVNDLPRVHPATRERVLDAVSRLGYRPNVMARRLAGGRSRVVGVVGFDTILYGPAATLLGVERAARERGYGISIVTLEAVTPAGMTAALESLADRSVAGVVVLAPHAGTEFDLPAGTAVVAPYGGPPALSVDQAAGARLAVEHLLGLGHRRVWHVSGPRDWLETHARIAGWRAAAGPPAPPVLTGDWSARSGYAAGRHLAGVRSADGAGAVTAVFAGNDQMALGLMRAFYEHGIRVPADVSIVGFDDIPESGYLAPPLTTIRQDFDEVGRRCITALLSQVEAATPLPEGPHVPPELVIRRSTAPPGVTG